MKINVPSAPFHQEMQPIQQQTSKKMNEASRTVGPTKTFDGISVFEDVRSPSWRSSLLPQLLVGGTSQVERVRSQVNQRSPRVLVQDYFEAFQKGDWKTMSRSYASNATFKDPIFPKGLKGSQIGAAWGDITQNLRPKVTFSNIEVHGDLVTAKWSAKYPLKLPVFGTNQIDNDITATFRIKDGKIVEHIEHFDMNEYIQEATGLRGLSFLVRPLVRNRIRAGALENMASFLREHTSFFQKK